MSKTPVQKRNEAIERHFNCKLNTICRVVDTLKSLKRKTRSKLTQEEFDQISDVLNRSPWLGTSGKPMTSPEICMELINWDTGVGDIIDLTTGKFSAHRISATILAITEKKMRMMQPGERFIDEQPADEQPTLVCPQYLSSEWAECITSLRNDEMCSDLFKKAKRILNSREWACKKPLGVVHTMWDCGFQMCYDEPKTTKDIRKFVELLEGAAECLGTDTSEYPRGALAHDGGRPVEPNIREKMTGGRKQPANEIQVGGDHYQTAAVQHWDFVHMHKIPYHEAQVIRYIMRHQSKNGIEDVLKARHFIDKIIELYYNDEPSEQEDGYYGPDR